MNRIETKELSGGKGWQAYWNGNRTDCAQGRTQAEAVQKMLHTKMDELGVGVEELPREPWWVAKKDGQSIFVAFEFSEQGRNAPDTIFHEGATWRRGPLMPIPAELANRACSYREYRLEESRSNAKPSHSRTLGDTANNYY